MSESNIPSFDRDLFGSKETFTRIGTGSIGGKASGLAFIKDTILKNFNNQTFKNITVDIPVMTVLATDIFDQFMEMNDFYRISFDDMTDERIAHAFQKGSFPTEHVGDLRGLIEKVKTPLAIRSSSLLEDAINHPFAGVYGTKMIPNNQPDADSRFKKMVEGIKFVYASTFFKEARDYIKVTGKTFKDEKMAVIIQEVVGSSYNNLYYPVLSGVGRTFNYYPFGHSEPEDGVLVLALGLGKTIVDGGKTWSVSPRYPTQPPPYNSNQDILRQTQTKFWGVNMGKPEQVDPLNETEYLKESDLQQAEYDDTIKHIASTYLAANDKIVIGCGNPGGRVLNFAPLLRLDTIPFADMIQSLMTACKESSQADVEIELAATIDKDNQMRVGMLQVRKMKTADSSIVIEDADLQSDKLILSSDRIMGNGQIDGIEDIIYIKPETFAAKHTPQIAGQIAAINEQLEKENRPYVLIGFGRWGSSDPWLGVPVVWSQISKAKVLVEATLPDMDVDLSQGAHFFHNLTSFNIFSFCIHHSSKHTIQYDWMNNLETVSETDFIRHVRTAKPLIIKADRKKCLGVISHDE